MFICEAPRNPSGAHLQRSKVSNEVTHTSSTDPNIEHWLSSCDVSVLLNSGISTLQHFGTNSRNRTAWVTCILELCFYHFRSHHSFHPLTNSDSVDLSTSISIADICGCFSLTLFWQHRILSQYIICTTCHWLTPLWSTAAVGISEIFTTPYLNAGNFKFVLSKISHS